MIPILKKHALARAARILAFATLGLAALYGLVIAFPEPAFSYKVDYQNYQVWSDEPIPKEIE